MDAKISMYLGDQFNAGGKENMTIRHCLLHNSGLSPDPVPWYWDPAFGCPNTADPQPREDFSCLASLIYNSLLSEAVNTPPGEAYVYSDIGFIALSFVVGTVATSHDLVSPEDYLPRCRADGLDGQDAVLILCAFESFVRTYLFRYEFSSPSSSFARLIQDLGLSSSRDSNMWMPQTQFLPPKSLWSACAPTLNDTGDGSYTHRRLQGQVADGDCYAMGGIAGHAGVFSTAPDIGRFLSVMLDASGGSDTTTSFLNATTVRYFTKLYNGTQSSRALGWTTNSDEVIILPYVCTMQLSG